MRIGNWQQPAQPHALRRLYAQDQWTRRVGSRCRARCATSTRGAGSRRARTAWPPTTVPRSADHVPATGWRHRLQRHHAARGRGLRSVRQRQDVAEGERRQVPRRPPKPGPLHHRQPGGHASSRRRTRELDRRQPQLHPGLRSDESGRAEQSGDGRRQLRRLEQLQLRQPASVPRASTPTMQHGWGVRHYDWQFGVVVQHEILPRRRSTSATTAAGSGFTVTDNLALGPPDFDQVTIHGAAASRSAGRRRLPRDVRHAQHGSLGATTTTSPSRATTAIVSQYWHGVDVKVNARLPQRCSLQGGTSSGRGVRDYCEVAAKLPELYSSAARGTLDQQPSCTSASLADAVPRPGVVHHPEDRRPDQRHVPAQARDVGVGRQRLGEQRQLAGSANYNVPERDAAAQTWAAAGGRRLRNHDGQSAAAGAHVRRPAQLSRPARRQDPAVRPDADAWWAFDLYNLFNSNPGLTYNQTFGPNYLRPTSILMPRFVRFNATVDF